MAALAAALATASAGAARAASSPTLPRLHAKAAILVEPATGDVVYARHAMQRRPIASTTKLMTALLTVEREPLGKVLVAAPYHPMPAESVIGLKAGERLTVADLLRGLLLASANDAAETLAVDIAGSRQRFVALMNARARQLGLRATHYANPIGLDQPGNYSTAEDLVKLALLLRRDRFAREVMNRPSTILYSGAHPRRIANRNTLVSEVASVDGVKTGHTHDAGYVLVGSATRHGVNVVSAVLGEPTEEARDADTLALLRYGLGRYRLVQALRAGQPLGSAPVKGRSGRRVGLLAGATLTRTIALGDRLRTRLAGVPGAVSGPLRRGARVGTVEVLRRGRVVARAPLVLAAAVPAPPARTGAILAAALAALATALATGSLVLVLLRRRAVRRRRRRAGSTGTA
ncbi:MAG TPA: D-alanyl-D-alanine carboxypeptidase family protein [Solirubrobacteraceae bacterium]|nr:D-alanyl-D-alanine carboxypeptidase family protein [Solirubrobacteraceae bacterium]